MIYTLYILYAILYIYYTLYAIYIILYTVYSICRIPAMGDLDLWNKAWLAIIRVAPVLTRFEQYAVTDPSTAKSVVRGCHTIKGIMI